MDSELLARSVSERMFARHCGIVNELLEKPSISNRMIERALAELTTRWTVLQEHHDSYVCKSAVTNSVKISAHEALIDKYKFEFVRLELAIDDFITAQHFKTPTASSAVSNNNSIKLERVKFRVFDGDLRKYPKFKSEFKTYVQPLCQPNQLPFILKSYLCDSVRRLVDHIDHDIVAMWERLDERYGSVRKQIDRILGDFKNLPPCNDVTSTLRMINIVETAEADLKCMNAANQLENALIISYIESSMSEKMLTAWAERIANDEDRMLPNTKMPKLLEFLKHKRELLEYCDADIRKTQNTDTKIPVVESSIHHVNAAVISPAPSCSDLNMSTRKCFIHQESDHPIWRCRTFHAMTLSQRKELITSNNACTLCLEKGHSSADCTKSLRCLIPDCHSTHHNVLLHDHSEE